MKLGRYDDAEDRFRACNRLAPNYAIGYTNLGIVLQHKAQLLAATKPELAKSTLADATAAHDKAVSLTPGDSTVYYWRATFRISQNDLSGAIQDLQTAGKLNPSDLRIWAALAETLTKAGRPAEAQPAIEDLGSDVQQVQHLQQRDDHHQRRGDAEGHQAGDMAGQGHARASRRGFTRALAQAMTSEIASMTGVIGVWPGRARQPWNDHRHSATKTR
jgi:predicted Zn-dependent protease